MQLTRTASLSRRQLAQAHRLWNEGYPASVGHAGPADLATYFDGLSDCRHYCLEAGDELLAWGLVFSRDGERWFLVIVAAAARGRGEGKRMLAEMMGEEAELCGWVIDHDRALLQDGGPYRSPLDFYRKLGFEVLSDVRLELPIISAVKIRWSLSGSS